MASRSSLIKGSQAVVRFGLTKPNIKHSEFWSLQVLCQSLTYSQGFPHMLDITSVSNCVYKYQPPFEEFQVLRVSVEKEGSIQLSPRQSPMVLMCLDCAGNHSLVERLQTGSTVSFGMTKLELLMIGILCNAESWILNRWWMLARNGGFSKGDRAVHPSWYRSHPS